VLLTTIIVVHVIVALFLIAVVLLQTGKAGNIADVFGGGGSMAAFGARGAATVLSRITWVAASLFLITSLSLSLIKSAPTSVLRDQPVQKAPAQTPAPQQKPPAQKPPNQ
jgi:preprotein translocase subunit SecG